MQGQAGLARHWPGSSAQLSLETALHGQVAAMPRGGSTLAEGPLPTGSLVAGQSGACGPRVCDRSPELGLGGTSCPFGLGPFSRRELWVLPRPPSYPMGG